MFGFVPEEPAKKKRRILGVLDGNEDTGVEYATTNGGVGAGYR